MTTYIIRRLLHALVVLWILSLLVFLTMRLLPGDPIMMLVSRDEFSASTPERIAELRHEHGLDRPMLVQYVDWLGQVARGNLGKSIMNKIPVAEEIIYRLPVTLHLGLVAFIVGATLGILLGILGALRRGTWVDNLVTLVANLAITAPPFWLGIILIYAFGFHLKLLPIYGYTSPLDDFWMSMKQSVLPTAVLMAFPMATTARQMRSSQLEVMRQDYVRTAWSKGLAERAVVMRHALKNALMPVVTIQGVVLRIVIGGSVVVESVFSIPGLGRLAVDSVRAQDYPLVQGITLLIATITVLINLGVDLIYGWLDPRIRYE